MGRLTGVVLAGSEGVSAGREHALGVVVRESGSLNVEIAHHGVGSPATKELDEFGRDVALKEGGGASAAQGANGRRSVGWHGQSNTPKVFGHQVVGDDAGGAKFIVVGVKRDFTKWGGPRNKVLS